jgi:hypothetical protein
MVFVDIFIIGISITRISFLSYLISAANESEMNFIVTPQTPAVSCHSLQDGISSAKSHEDMSREICGAVSGWLSVKLTQSLLPSGARTAWK